MKQLLIRQFSSKALVYAPGVIWQSCVFQPDDVYSASDGDGLCIDLPDDLRKAVAKRRSEFLAGRLCAARALATLAASTHVGRNGRAPIWPTGICGAISHTDRRVIAVVTRNFGGVGVDGEQIIKADLAETIAPTILAARDTVHFLKSWSFAQNLTVAFTAKEAAYKALASDLPDIPDFAEADVVQMTQTFVTLEFRGMSLQIRFQIDAEMVIALCLHAAVNSPKARNPQGTIL